MDKRRFTNEWFTRDVAGFWNTALNGLVPFDGSAVYLEIGVCEGASMLWVLDHVRPAKAYGVDPYRAPKPRLQPAYDVYRANAAANLAPFVTSGVVRLIYEASEDYLRRDSMPLNSVDLFYVDGDHRASATLTDAVLGWRFVKPGGLVIFDDYNRRWHMGKPWTHEGVDAFLHAFEQRYEIAWRNKVQVAVRKLK